MALDNFTGQRIQETFQKLIQTEGGVFADGTGSAISIITADQTGSFAHKTAISGAFYAPSASISARLAILESTEDHLHNKTLSSSFQIESEISGAFTDLSGSIATRFDGLTSEYSELTGIPVGIVSSSLQFTTQSNVTFNDITSSGIINTTNINVGTPTSNNWGENLQGSYFNNFNANTDVSEILRFIAGILSGSAANPTPNTKTYNSILENKSNTGHTSAPAGRIPQDNDIPDLTYLINNGFASEGGELFSSINPSTIRTNTGYSISYSSNDGGSTSVGSNLSDTDLFGLGVLDSGNASAFKVSGSHIFKFYRSQAAKNANSPTETSSSGKILTNSSFGTSNGLTIAKINTVNPAVIPAAFQDGKFFEVHSQNVVNWTNETLTSISASGYYEINTTIGIATGSQSEFITKSASETIFWAPISNLTSNISSQTIGFSGTTVTALTLTSASLSGAPYVNGGTWNLATTASGVFEPMYAADNALVDVEIVGDDGYTISNTSGTDTLSTYSGNTTYRGKIRTSGMVTSADGTTVRAYNSIPHRTDLVEIDAVYSISGTGDTINETGFSDSQFQLNAKAKNRSGNVAVTDENDVPIHVSGRFGQPDASGSMGYFGGGDSATNKLAESFCNETYRRVISDSTSLTNVWNSETNLTLGDGGDLQVKPGYLVNPESSKGYWYHDSGYNASYHKWYLREFDTDASNNQSNLIINLDNPGGDNDDDLVTFDNQSVNKISIGVIFGSATSTIFDVVKGNQSYGGTLNTTSTSSMNPFSDDVDIVGDFSSKSESNGTLTLGLNNGIGQTINSTHDKIWLLIRYKGTPVETLEKITVSTS